MKTLNEKSKDIIVEYFRKRIESSKDIKLEILTIVKQASNHSCLIITINKYFPEYKEYLDKLLLLK